jgi:hypothetical protein
MQMAKDDKDRRTGKAGGSSIEATLLALAKPRMTPKELLKLTRKAHPEASKKEIIRAAFHSIIAVADSDVDKAVILQNFALQERAVDDV